MKHISLIREFFNSHPNLPPKSEKKVLDYLTLLLEERSVRKITSSSDPLVLTKEHIIPSMELGLKIDGENHVDIGSGAGFPVVPMSIINPGKKFTLMEPMKTRGVFLQSLILKLKMDNVEFLQIRAEDAARDSLYREKFDSVTARAVLPLVGSVELALPLLKVGGSFYAQPGDSALSQIELAKEKIQTLGGVIVENLDGLVVIQKSGPSPNKYPRNWKRIFKDSRA